MPKPAPKTDRKERAALSAERIATEAMKLVDEAGMDGFSFRNLAARLGCQAMSLYHYYPSKAHLFEALVDICIAETPIPPEGPPWRERIHGFCANYRQTALRHPGFFLYFATFRLNNASGLAFLEAILKMMSASGLETQALSKHFRAIGYYVTGAGIDEAMGYAQGPSAVDPVSSDVAMRDFPAIMAVGQYFGKAYHAGNFEHGLNILLDRMEEDARDFAARTS